MTTRPDVADDMAERYADVWRDLAVECYGLSAEQAAEAHALYAKALATWAKRELVDSESLASAMEDNALEWERRARAAEALLATSTVCPECGRTWNPVGD